MSEIVGIIGQVEVLSPRETVSLIKFDPSHLRLFSNRSVSEETRRVYKRVVAEFFKFVNQKHPALVGQEEMIFAQDVVEVRKAG